MLVFEVTVYISKLKVFFFSGLGFEAKALF